jgi:hypothetical protein
MFSQFPTKNHEFLYFFQFRKYSRHSRTGGGTGREAAGGGKGSEGGKKKKWILQEGRSIIEKK